MTKAESTSQDRWPVGVRGLSKEHIEVALARYQQIVSGRKRERTPGAKLPRATETRPYRFCVQDVVLAIWTMAHRKDHGDIFVDVFLTSEVYEKETRKGGYYDELAGATAAILTILSEAFRVGIPLKVQFGKSVEGGRVPLDIVRLALRHGIGLADAENGRIGAAEGTELYLALTGFQTNLRQAINQLAQQGLMSPERAAYIVHHGVWSLPEVEGIILGSNYPDLVLSGDLMPEQRHLYQHVLAHSRLALMGGLLDRSIASRDDMDPSHPEATAPGLDVEDDDRNLDIRTFARFHSREYILTLGTDSGMEDSFPLPDWECERTRLHMGEHLSVLLRPRTASSIQKNLMADLEQAAVRRSLNPEPSVVGVAVPFDFHDLPTDRQRQFREEAKARNVALMVCPETVRSLDQIAQQKVAASRITKD